MGAITDVSELGIDPGLKYNTTTKVLSAPTGYVAIGQSAATGARLDICTTKDDALACNRYRMTSMSHGMTTILPTDCYGQVGVGSHAAGYAEGGLQIVGVGANGTVSYSGITILSLHGSTDPGDTVPALLITTGKRDGTSYTGMGAAETCLQIFNNTSKMLEILGNGDVGINILPAAKLHLYQSTAFAACKIRTQIASLGDYWEAGSAYAASTHQYNFAMSGTVKMAIDTYGLTLGSYAGVNLAPSGGLILSGKLGIATSDPSGKLDIYSVKTTPPYSIVLSQQDLAHGITTLAPTGSFGVIQSLNTSGYAEGGLLIRGISNSMEDTSGNVVGGLMLDGILANDSTEGHASAVTIRGSTKDGTGIQALDSSYGIVFTIYNYNTALLTMWGSGFTSFAGTIAVDHIYNATSLHPITFDYDVKATTKLGVAVTAAAAPFAVVGLAASPSGLATGDFYYIDTEGTKYVCVV